MNSKYAVHIKLMCKRKTALVKLHIAVGCRVRCRSKM